MNKPLKEKLTKREFLLKLLEKEQDITNWHLNDDFIEYGNLFFKPMEDTLGRARRSFNYECNKLVKEGVLEPAIKIGIGSYAMFDFGTRTQTYWRKKNNPNK